jgi:hypothetical protein
MIIDLLSNGLHQAVAIRGRDREGRMVMRLVQDDGQPDDPAGTSPAELSCRTTSASCRCRPFRPTVWRLRRKNCLLNRVCRGYDGILAHCRDAWNELIDQPWQFRSVRQRSWPEGF